MDEQQRIDRRECTEPLVDQNTSPPDRVLWVWLRSDPVPPRKTHLAVRFEVSVDDDELARAASVSVAEIDARRRLGNRPYVARVDGNVAAYGWACYGTAECGSKNLPFTVRDGDCYLWDFATLPRWRGNGLYSGLLDWILGDDDRILRYWIMHIYDNQASRRGIARAGFQIVAALYDRPDGRFRMVPMANITTARLAAIAFSGLLDPPLSSDKEAA